MYIFLSENVFSISDRYRVSTFDNNRKKPIATIN